MDSKKGPKAWLVVRSGPKAGTRHALNEPVTRVGRAGGNEVVFAGDEAAFVSSRHLEIRNEPGGFRLIDLNSTNGTFVNAERVTETLLSAGAIISLGVQGPQLFLELESESPGRQEQTLVMEASTLAEGLPPVPGPAAKDSAPASTIDARQEELLSDAVRRARRARQSGSGDQTAIIMREMLGTVITRSKRPLRRLIVLLTLALVVVGAVSIWQIRSLKREKVGIDGQIREVEARLSAGVEDARELESLIATLNTYEQRARSLQTGLFYRLGVRDSEQDFVEEEIKRLLAEFGAEEYSIPPEFLVQVNRFIRQYQERDRPNMERALGRARKELEKIRAAFRGENLPEDLAYMVLVESAFITGNQSSAGALGLWQFTEATARAYGLRVDGQADERLDDSKSTRAAGRYIRELILDFGTGSSVMLALAAYNLGPGKVKQAVRKVEDPIKQRNFWYLYRVRALPQETREYVPKIIAVIIIGRNPDRFGFA
jgi:membrane-bound lytic murein transglycosylase D